MKKMKLIGMAISTIASVTFLAACGTSAPSAPEASPVAPGSNSAPAETVSERAAPRDPAKDSNWVIEMDDTQEFAIGPTKVNMNMKMTGTKSTPGIAGEYQANATAKIGTFTAIAEGTGTTDTGSVSDPFAFTVKPFVALAPLAPRDNLEPAPLVPNPEWEADGSITMATSGRAVARGFPGSLQEKSALPFHMTITEGKVMVSINFPDLGTKNFYGTLREVR